MAASPAPKERNVGSPHERSCWREPGVQRRPHFSPKPRRGGTKRFRPSGALDSNIVATNPGLTPGATDISPLRGFGTMGPITASAHVDNLSITLCRKVLLLPPKFCIFVTRITWIQKMGRIGSQPPQDPATDLPSARPTRRGNRAATEPAAQHSDSDSLIYKDLTLGFVSVCVNPKPQIPARVCV